MNRPELWSLRSLDLPLTVQPIWMGIVNVTPDSFSDGGQFDSTGRAIAHALELVKQGANILDIGGESTRPYSQSVSAKEEVGRVLPVIRGIVRQTDVPISIDTSKAAVAEAAIDAGAQIINDVTGLSGDPAMIPLALDSGVGVCAMHMQGTPQTMQDHPVYSDVVEDIFSYLQQRKQQLLAAGIPLPKICLDPGIGFGKTHQHNLELIRRVDRFHDLGCPLLVGHSRKGFIGSVLHNKEVERDSGTAGVSVALAMRGVQILRVHHVGINRRVWELFRASETIVPESSDR